MNAATPERWAQLWRRVTTAEDPSPVHQELVSLYSQPHRHYHNFRHIGECLAEFASARHLARQPDAVALAIWFHDAVYEPRAQDNEQRSAELAKRRLGEAGARPGLGSSVAALILATKAHDPSLHPDAPLLIDIDLSILGQPEARFAEYEAQIRREYDWVPQAVFAAKRAEILGRFLARERIYTSEPFFSKYERRARANLQESIRKLKAGEVKTPAEGSLLWWVIPGVLAGMPMPFIHLDRRMNLGGALCACEDDLPVLHSAGVRAVVSLLNIPSDASVYESAGFSFLCLPVPDGGAPTMEQAQAFVPFVREQRAAHRPVAVHCEAGLGRTGTMLAVYLISEGDSAETAIRRVREVEKVAVETPRQIQFLEEFEHLAKTRST